MRLSHLTQWNVPLLSIGPVHFRFKGCIFFIFIKILIIIIIELSVNKQWRPWSFVAFCGVWSGSALFVYVPQKDVMFKWDKKKQSTHSAIKMFMILIMT